MCTPVCCHCRLSNQTGSRGSCSSAHGVIGRILVSCRSLITIKTMAAHTGPLRPALLLLLLAAAAQAQPHAWVKQLPPDRYYQPDVDTTSAILLPRVPASPYHMGVDNCPQQNDIPYAVEGYPGTPFLQTPFSVLYTAPPHVQPTTTVCRTGDLDPKHCMSAYDMTIQSIQARPYDATIPSCQLFPPTDMLGYNGMVRGPTITQPM